MVGHKDDPAFARYYNLSFAKRPPVELYDCKSDPDQVNNLADDPTYAGTVEQLREQLAAYLRATDDPRFTGGQVKFDECPYRTKYIGPYLKQHGF